MGEAGVGKSRLAWELTRSHRTQGWLVLESGSVSYGKATPYLPVIELLKAYCRIQERDGPREVRERVAGKLLTLDRALEPLLAPLLALLDVPVDDAAWDALDRAQRRQRTLDAVKRLLLRESQIQPLLVLFEDLHWIDSETQALLDALIESLPTARILLLVNYRPEYEHAWGRKTYYLQLRIDPLPPESAGALLGALLGEDPSLAPLTPVLIERTDGNPFFLEESVRTLVETQVLVGERGAYRLTRAPAALQIPATAQAILAARIDRLAPEDKRLLQAAAVIGKDVPFALLQAIADMPEDTLRRGLGHLQAAEFLYEASLFPDLEYTFKHALTHEVAYGSLLQDRRCALHARIVDAIETLSPDRLVEQVERLARPCLPGRAVGEGGDLPPAGRGQGLRPLGQPGGGRVLRAVADGVEPSPPSPGRPWSRASTFAWLSETRSGLSVASRPASAICATPNGWPRSWAIRDGWAGSPPTWPSILGMTGHAADAPAFAERALTIGEGLGDLPLRVAANYYLGSAYFAAGDYRRTDEFFPRILQLLEGDRFRERCGLAGFPVVMSRMFWTLALAERGEFEQGLTEAQEGVRLAEALDHPYSLACALRGLGRPYAARGDLDRAIRFTERALALSRDRHLPQIWPELADQLGYVYALSGRVVEGLSVLEEALTAFESMGMFQWRTPLIAHLGEAYLLASRPEDALTMAERGLALSRERGHRGSEAWTLRLLGAIAGHGDRLDAAKAERLRPPAVALATELGMRPLVAHCHLGLGELHRRTGDRTKAARTWPPRRRCTARWGWTSGWRRRRPRPLPSGANDEQPGASRGTGASGWRAASCAPGSCSA